jgi:RNA polymerase sigma-70 factor (sigma-E family)
MSVVRTAATDTSSGFDAFVTARGPALLRTAYLLTGDRQRAEDLVQTALGKTWPRWDSIDAGPREAYVRKVMLTTYIAWWRRRWNAEYPTEQLPDVPERPGDPDQRRDLLTALATLPKGQRAVVVLRYFEDLTEVQTAELLGCTVGTVKSQHARALATLRDCPALADQEGRTP